MVKRSYPQMWMGMPLACISISCPDTPCSRLRTSRVTTVIARMNIMNIIRVMRVMRVMRVVEECVPVCSISGGTRVRPLSRSCARCSEAGRMGDPWSSSSQTPATIHHVPITRYTHIYIYISHPVTHTGYQRVINTHPDTDTHTRSERQGEP